MKPLNFENLQDFKTVFLHLQCSPEVVYEILHHPEQHYEELRIPRKDRSHRPRVVYRLSNHLRQIQRTIAIGLRASVECLPENVHGFRMHRSIVSNASIHCGHDTIVTADIADFFGAIDIHAVWQIFQTLGCERQIALMLARICTLRGTLPQGARTSPALANLATRPLDEAILRSWPKANYTRYADDLAFSGDQLPLEDELSAVLQQFNYVLKAGSYKWQERSRGQYVTGLSVINSVPAMPRRARRMIERDLHFCRRFGVKTHLKRRYGTEPSHEDVVVFRTNLLGRIFSWGRVDIEKRRLWTEEFKKIEDSRGTDSPE